MVVKVDMEHREDGATDVRLVQATSGTWYDTSHASWETDKSLLSRIMVAGGGGGANTRGEWYGYGSGGAGGGLVGGSGTTEGQTEGGIEYPHSYGTGGTQTEGGHTRFFKNEIVICEDITAYFGNATYYGEQLELERTTNVSAIRRRRRILRRRLCATWRRRPEALHILADIPDV